MSEQQNTILSSVSLCGVGLHTGKEVTLTFKPAPENFGYKFQRVDLPGSPIVEVLADNVADVSRGTSLEKNGVKISTIEHAIAAAVGLDIDNLLIELNGQEIPIMDGSAKDFVEALQKAGIQKQGAKKKYYKIKEPITFVDEKNQVELTILPSEDYKVTVLVDYNNNSLVLGNQHAEITHINQFVNEIASSRTFCFLHELEQLLAQNLIKGGDLSNAIVVVDKVISQQELDQLAKLFNKPKVEVKKEGILNNLELRYTNELARHKLLDVIGDLALVGMPIKGHVIAKRPGHASNVSFAKKIRQHMNAERSPKAPVIDLNAPPLYDINKIIKILPHRPPFLLIDRIMEMSDTHIIGLKNVTMNEPFFAGHFPGEPVMPGVLQIEAMAQVGGIFALSTVSDPENYVTYFLKIDNARFKQKVVPGDTLVFKLELLSPIRRGICHMQGSAYVGDKVVMEAELLAQIVKNKK
jgi:UDP-3-O-[3-hydroxymyristoyl] N-acetylglucosamine deacetylase/3-hydroxyacyl-[acyl-carrier-protein] dehydratase